MEFLAEYHLWIMIAALVGLILLPQEYRKKKSVLTVMAFLAFSIGYEVIMSEPVTSMPRRINHILNGDGTDHTENPHYYNQPEKRIEKRYGTPGDF